MRRGLLGCWVLAVFVALILLISGFRGFASRQSAEITAVAAPPPSTTATFVGWRDDFNNTSKVGASAGVVFTAGNVSLLGAGLSRQGLVLPLGSPGSFDSGELGSPTVILDGGLYKMWYHGGNGGLYQIGYATSQDRLHWTKYGVVVAPSLPAEGSDIGYADVIKVGVQYWMWYAGFDGTTYRILAANSTDGLSWTKHGVVVDVGSAGSADDQSVYEPSVLFESGTYEMWYTGRNTLGTVQLLFANSTNGLTWTKDGVVLSTGPQGSGQADGVGQACVRHIGSSYKMLYTGTESLLARIFSADSPDGRTWTKRGLALDLLAPDESSIVGYPTCVVESDGSWSVFYEARGAALQIFFATRLAPGAQTGWVRSVPISIPSGLAWGWFNQTVSQPTGAWINVTVRDGTTLIPIPGLENLSAGPIDIHSLASDLHPTLAFEAWLHGNETATPVLDEWDISWTDSLPPSFAGIANATDEGTSGNVRLGWVAATDPSLPVTYSIYITVGSRPLDYSRSNYTTQSTSLAVSGLSNGLSYTFGVRASDRWGNQDANTVTRSAVPTTPIDSTPPDFAGLGSATDVGVGGTVRLSWQAAIDPVPPSNTAPSLPIQYLVFEAANGSSFDFAAPTLTTQNASAVVTGLTDGVTYRFLVRAMDHAGNMENNTVIRTAVPTHPYDDVPPVFSGVGGVTDRGDGSSVLVSWTPATDPNTPRSNAPPSLPITYSVWVSDNATAVETGQPWASTQATTLIVTGLQPGRTYYILVRASDAAGNHESNLRIASVQVATPWWAYWWIGAIAGVAIVAVIVFWRLRGKGAASQPATVPGDRSGPR